MSNGYVYKRTLSNGLDVLLAPDHTISKVSLQLWYNVGSRDEIRGRKGIAHLIEHMIFKGTETLSESDINTITYKLSGSANAFTSHDYTGYLFDMPSQHWHKVLPIMADCMRNCTFKQELLNSELRAIVQEIKLYNDDYMSCLLEGMTSAIFHDHPYRDPVIGYKKDIIHLSPDDLRQFYQYHYIPNNAALVVVGDIDIEQSMQWIEEQFGSIEPYPVYEKMPTYHQPDLASRSLTLYRDIQQPMVTVMWEVPGTASELNYVFDIFSWILGAGNGSRLYRRLVNQLDLVSNVQSFVHDLFEHGLFGVYFQPHNIADVDAIITVINEEIDEIMRNGVRKEEVDRGRKKTLMDFLSVQEDYQKRAYVIGKLYLATGNPRALTDYCEYDGDIGEKIQELANKYLAPSQMHSGQVLPLSEPEKERWKQMQEQSDKEDEELLSHLNREAELEEPKYAVSIKPERPRHFDFPKPEIFTLSNGIKVLYYHQPKSEKLDLVLDLKAKYYFDPEDKQGLSMLLSNVLEEGTEQRDADELAYALESRGMELNILPGHMNMSMLHEDTEQGLSLLHEVITQPAFDENGIKRARQQLIAEVKSYWDSPNNFCNQLIREEIYKDHPYSKHALGTLETVSQITESDLRDAYKKYITPDGARIAVVGGVSREEIERLLEKTIGTWQGPAAQDIEFPEVQKPKSHTIDRYMNRDQVVLCYAGLSVDRDNDDFDPLFLFDQIFTGGILGGMNSRLFALRERTGFFYAIGGSLLHGVGREPGMVLIKALTSSDDMAHADRVIKEAIEVEARGIPEHELQEAQNAVINSLSDNFATNRQIATSFIFLDKFDLPLDYFDKRAEQLLSVTMPQIKEAANRVLELNHIITLRIGRVA